MGMPHKSSIDVIAVWLITGIGNLISWALTGFVKYLPIIQTMLGIVSILLAIGYTLYKWKRDWKGFNPKDDMDKRER